MLSSSSISKSLFVKSSSWVTISQLERWYMTSCRHVRRISAISLYRDVETVLFFQLSKAPCRYWRISVVLCLLSSHIFHIYENITCKSEMVIVVNKNRFSGKMSAFTLKQLKMQFSEINETGLFYKLTYFFFISDNFYSYR